MTPTLYCILQHPVSRGTSSGPASQIAVHASIANQSHFFLLLENEFWKGRRVGNGWSGVGVIYQCLINNTNIIS